MKKLFLVLALCFFSTISFCQTSVENRRRVDPGNDPKLAEFKEHHDNVIAKSVQPSLYLGYDETLKSFFKDNIIPAQTPKAEAPVSKAEYVKIVNEWISKNKHLLKPEHKNSLIVE